MLLTDFAKEAFLSEKISFQSAVLRLTEIVLCKQLEFNFELWSKNMSFKRKFSNY